MSPRRRSTRLLFVALCALAFAFTGPGDTDAQVRVQPPAKTKVSKANITAVKRARNNRIKPAEVTRIGTKLSTKVLGGTTMTDKGLRGEMAVAPLKARLSVFQKVANSKGHTVQSFTRRLRGMVKNGKKNKVVTAEKTFFEVLPATVNDFRESMGENVIWFAASASPGHLHTLVADQDGGSTLTHNTYGATMDEATIPRLQYLAPAHVDKAQMARFTKYLNAGVDAGHSEKGKVYGFKKSNGEWVYQTACTNWATSAPIGDLHRWAQTVDKNIMKEVKSGALGAEFKDGLHAALAKASTPAARQTVLATALSAPGLSKWTKSSAKRLGKEFDIILEKFPNRPAELVARQSLSEVMGVARSQDPAKWMYDLVLSKTVPVVGVLATERAADFKNMQFDMEIMGTITNKGTVVKGEGYGAGGVGVIPVERGGVGVAQ